MKIYKSELLNNKLQPCLTDAVFQENQFDEPSRIVDSAVETFNSAYTDAAKALSIATEATPIGEGVGKETKIIHEVALSWNGKAWIGSGQHFEIEISPECDIHDVSVWLKNFKWIIKLRLLLDSLVCRIYLAVLEILAQELCNLVC